MRKLINVFTQLTTPFSFVILVLVSTCLLYVIFVSETEIEVNHIMPIPMVNKKYNTSISSFSDIVKKENQHLCYENFVWDDSNQHLKFKNIFDDDELTKSKGQNIFFHITDCIYDGIPVINPRQACAVESAARINSHLSIFLTFTAPVGFLNDSNMPIMNAMMSYKNVFIRNVDLVQYAEDTPAEEWVKSGKLFESKYLKVHVSDFLRLCSLYRFGGTYLDLDTVMLKNISNIGVNYAGAETNISVANAIINLDPSTETGRTLGELFLMYFRNNFYPMGWANNGPHLVTNVMRKFCAKPEIEEMTRENCKGFVVYDDSYFYAVSNQEFYDAFKVDPDKVKRIFKLIENSTLIHMSNTLSRGRDIKVGDGKAYGILAEMYCPRVYNSLGHIF